MKIKSFFALILIAGMLASCSQTEKRPAFTGAEHEVKLITLNPGHFHAALVQREMYDQVHPMVNIFAPDGPDLTMHLERIERFNTRSDNPTSWESNIYTGEDYLERMLAERPGNVVVIAGNNRKKTSYIKRSVEAGLNVLSDKPMAINGESFEKLRQAFEIAEMNDVLLYDIMTERYEITSQLQREIALIPELFGVLEKGTPDDPAVVKESVHHFFKYVAGAILQRPPWYFDTEQQGEGIVDVTTHLVDLVQWISFPDVIINYSTDIEMLDATRRPTEITRQQFFDVTGLDYIPYYLGDADAEVLHVYANGEMDYRINGVHARVSVVWDFEAPEGGGDTHFSVMKGSKTHLIIRQGQEEGFVPVLFMVPAPGMEGQQWAQEVEEAFAQITEMFPGIVLSAVQEGFRVDIPSEYRIGHEAHFARVAEKYLQFLIDGKLPDWEVPNMLSKYYTTTRAFEMARAKSAGQSR